MESIYTAHNTNVQDLRLKSYTHMHNTGTELTEAEADTHTWCYTHLTLTQNTMCSAGQMAVYMEQTHTWCYTRRTMMTQNTMCSAGQMAVYMDALSTH